MATTSPATFGAVSVTDGVSIPAVVTGTGDAAPTSDSANTAPDIAYWEPIAASALVSLLVGLPGLVILFLGTSLARKKKLFNVFS